MPLFRQATEEHLSRKVFYPDDRRYMVRVLATMILSHVSKASVSDSEHVAKALVQKFPFLKEYVSMCCLSTSVITCSCMLITFLGTIHLCQMPKL